MISRFQAEIGTATLTTCLGLVAVVGALEFGIGWGDAGPESGTFPFYMGILIIGASLGTVIQTVKSRYVLQSVFLDREQAGRVASFLVPIIFFVATSVVLGLYVATALYLTFVLWRQGGYRLAVSALSGITAAVFFYLVLEYAFRVPLLKGPLENALGLY